MNDKISARLASAELFYVRVLDTESTGDVIRSICRLFTCVCHALVNEVQEDARNAVCTGILGALGHELKCHGVNYEAVNLLPDTDAFIDAAQAVYIDDVLQEAADIMSGGNNE